MERPIEAMTELIDDGYPVFLTGDFNQPSSLDYARRHGRHPQGDRGAGAVAGERGAVRARVPRHLPGDASRSGRDPGITQDSTGERIDYVYAAGPSTTLDSELVGEPGGDDVEIEAAPWTSDHRAVLSSFEVTPVAMPTLIAVDARLRTVGDEITVTHNAPGSGDNEIAIVPEGGDPADPIETLARPPTNAERRRSTHPAGTPAATTPSWPTATATRPLASRSTSAIREARLELSTDQDELRARRAGRGLVGAGARQPLGLARGLRGGRRRTPRWTTT